MKKIGKYDIVEELGHGGMGVVYKAYDSVMEREVAIKVISDLMLAVPEIRNRFYREARMAGKLSHENITVVYDVAEDEGRPYIVMEYLPGSDLTEILAREEPISFLQKLDWSIQICRGLSFSHSKDIVHRDIKPANIRIVGGKVKIMDFGIARPTSSSMTTTGTVIGTPFYMSPEQIQGRKVDKRSDIFSFGVLFYELLTGKKPFYAEEPTAVMFKIVYEEPEWIDETRIDHRAGLKDIVMKILAKDPDKRYQDLSEVADALENIASELRTVERRRAEEIRGKVRDLINEGRSLVRNNEFKKARDVAQQAARIDPANTEIPRFTQEITSAEQLHAKRAYIEGHLRDARNAFDSKNFEKTQQILKELLSREPGQTEALQMMRDVQDAIAFKLTGDARYARTSRPDGTTILVTPGGEPSSEPELEEAKPEPARVQPARPEPARPEPARPEPARPEPARPEPAHREQSRPPGIRHETPRPRPAEHAGRMKYYLIGAVVLIAIASAVVYRLAFYVPPPPGGFVALNILPWAHVAKITVQGGGDFPLQEKTDTPCRLFLPEGSYEIQLTNPAYAKPIILSITVKKGEVQQVKKKFSEFDVQQVLSKIP